MSGLPELITVPRAPDESLSFGFGGNDRGGSR
jgi:hypothetical protein